MTEIYKFDYKIFNPIQDRVAGGGWEKGLTTSSFPVISTKEGISHKNFLNFSIKLFATVV